MKTVILGHTIVVDGLDAEISDNNIYQINQGILDGNDSGTITQDGNDFDWEIETYLLSKVAILEEKDEVVFEYKGVICQIWTSEEGYMYNMYDFEDFTDGEELNSVDGGCCTGSAKDAVFMAIGE